MSERTDILHGIRVVEAATMVMVPSAAAVMAEYGAEVIKVEPLIGDLNRRGHHIPGMPDSDYEYCFLPDNRNKKSVAIDLGTDEGRDLLYRLVDRADVFFTNYRIRALRKLGLTWEELERRNSRLIYAHGTGYGDHGPEADKPGFDAVCYWSRSGLEATMFPIEGWLGSLTYGSGDHPSGMSLFGAVMMALFARERSGRGCRVSTSLLANGAWSNAVTIQARLVDARFHPRLPRDEARNFAAVYYRARDERIFKLTIVDHEATWPRFCRAIGRDEWIEDPRYATGTARNERMAEIIRLCDEIFARHDVEHWSREFERHDVPYSVIADYDDVVADRQMAANDVFAELEDPDRGRLRTLTGPIRVDGHARVPVEPAPRLGQHTREVLEGLELETDHIASLLERGIVRIAD